MRLFFATTNPIKVDSTVRILQELGIDVEVVAKDIPEIQADTAAEVAAGKAREAFRQLGAPVLVNDFAIHFEALGGFPGPYVKYVTRTIGLEGYFRALRTSNGHLSHACTLVSALAYMDAGMDAPKTFERATPGCVASHVYDALPRKPKEEELVMDVFVPDGETLSIGQMPKGRFEAWRRRPAHEKFYRDFAQWLIARAA